MNQEKYLKKIINEELSKHEISAMIADKIDSKISSKDFEKLVKQISIEVVNNLFKTLWQKNNIWKSTVANS